MLISFFGFDPECALTELLIRKLDAQLDQIGQGVARLKNIALDMNAEIKTQVRRGIGAKWNECGMGCMSVHDFI